MPAVQITDVDDTAVVNSKKESTTTATEWTPTNPITLKKVQDICVKNGFYKTPSCNEKLYLHHKGWDKIADLEPYTECRVLWLEGNCLQKIEGLESMRTSLRSLYLQENMLTSLEGVNAFEYLDSLNVSDNHISSLKGLLVGAEPSSAASDAAEAAAAAVQPATYSTPNFSDENKIAADELAARKEANAESVATGGKVLKTLNTLQIKNNHLKEMEDIQILTQLENLSVLDLTGNKIEDGEGLLEILAQMPNLKSLRLSGNPCVRNMSMYRRTVVSRCINLMHLDDRPIFADERRLVTAFTNGGAEGEKAERLKMREEEKEKIQRRLDEFADMCRNAGASQAQIDGGVGVTDEENTATTLTDPALTDTDGQLTDSLGQPTDDDQEEDDDHDATSSATSCSSDEEDGTAVQPEVANVEAPAAEEDANTPTKSAQQRRHMDPELEASKLQEESEASQHIERAPPGYTASPSSNNSGSPTNLRPNANSKYAKIWEMATQVSDAKEKEGQEPVQDKSEDAPDSDDEGDAWVPE